MRPALLSAAFATAGLVGPVAAQAVYLETVCGSSVLDGSKTYCDRGATFDLVVGGTSDVMQLRLTAPATHCSPVSYLVAEPPPPPLAPGEVGAVPATPLAPVEFGHNVRAPLTGVLGPGESEVVDLGRGWARGRHPLMIMVIGHVADCNVGQIHSWGVNVEQMIFPQ